MLRRAVLLAAATALLHAAPAQAAQLWVSTSGPASGACLPADPCELSYALGQATVADQVIVTPGTYLLSAPLAVTVDVKGEPGKPAPVLDGAPGFAADAVSASGTGARLSHLHIVGRASGRNALTLTGGARGDRLTLDAPAGNGVKLETAAAGTVLTNSLVRATDTAGPKGVTLKDENAVDPGSLALRNVTAYAPYGTGVSCKNVVADAAVVNVLARGGDHDLDFDEATRCEALATNARAAKVVGLSGGSALVQGEPVLDGAYRPLSTSAATIDRGTDDAANGAADLAGNPRRSGRTDIGAFEHDGPADPPSGGRPDGRGDQPDAGATPPPAPAAPRATPAAPSSGDPPAAGPLAPPAPPKLGKTVRVDVAGTGTVRIRLPGTNRYVPLSDAASVPVGATVDARKGAVTLSSALPGGKRQTGTFGGGMFTVRQSARSRGMTDIALAGGAFRGCPRTAKPTARAAAARRRTSRKGRRSTVRRLWARDKGGRFRTHGRDSVATVRGTRWLTVDRCDGTYTKVTQGAVDVEDKRTGRVRRIRAGRSILVRHR